jgi:hypothetical protein
MKAASGGSIRDLEGGSVRMIASDNAILLLGLGRPAA